MATYDWPFVDVPINKKDILLDPSLGYSFSARMYSLHRAAWSSPQGWGRPPTPPIHPKHPLLLNFCFFCLIWGHHEEVVSLPVQLPPLEPGSAQGHHLPHSRFLTQSSVCCMQRSRGSSCSCVNHPKAPSALRRHGCTIVFNWNCSASIKASTSSGSEPLLTPVNGRKPRTNSCVPVSSSLRNLMDAMLINLTSSVKEKSWSSILPLKRQLIIFCMATLLQWDMSTMLVSPTTNLCSLLLKQVLKKCVVSGRAGQGGVRGPAPWSGDQSHQAEPSCC